MAALTRKQDAFGQAMDEWPKRFFGDLYARVAEAQFTPAQSERQARLVARMLHLRKGMDVLDIPCGFGRLTLPLARRGLAMTGVDLTGPYVRKARRAARAGKLNVRFFVEDMRRIGFHGEFDAAFNWFTSFGFYSEEDNLLCLRRLRDALRPGGRLLIETINRSWIMSHFRASGEQTIAGVRIVQTNRRFDPSDRYTRSTWTFSYRGRRTRTAIAIRLYDGAEMRRLLRRAGFVDIRMFGHDRLDHPPSPHFTRHSRRVMALARRP